MEKASPCLCSHSGQTLQAILLQAVEKWTTERYVSQCVRNFETQCSSISGGGDCSNSSSCCCCCCCSACQSQLPATGAPVSHVALHSAHMTQLYDSYVRSSTLANWKFWIVSFLHAVHFCVVTVQFFFGWSSPCLALPSGWAGCYTCPALRPYQLSPMRIPKCNHKVTSNGYKAVDGCEAVNRQL